MTKILHVLAIVAAVYYGGMSLYALIYTSIYTVRERRREKDDYAAKIQEF